MKYFLLFILNSLWLPVIAQKQLTIVNSETGEEMTITVPDGLVITSSDQDENDELAVVDTIYADNGASNACVADTIDAGSLNLKEPITQHKWTKYEYIDTCTARYAVVHDWNGRCGIYDLEKKENITELEYRALHFSRLMELADGSQAALFYGFQGHRKGIVSVGPDNDVMSMLMPDDDMAYKLDSCRTIDKSIMKLSRKLLKKDMKEHGGMYGQVLVLESQTGNVKAWVALQDELHDGNLSDASLLKHQLCTDPQKAFLATMCLVDSNTSWNDSVDTKCGTDTIDGLLIRDHNWHRGGYGKITYLEGFKQHSNIALVRALEKANSNLKHDWWEISDNPREMDALSVAALYNVTALNGEKLVIPSVNTASITNETPGETAQSDIKLIHMLKEYLKATLQDGGIGSRLITKNVDISGEFIVHRNCRPTLYDDNLKDVEKYYSDEGLQTYNQVIFTGYFPSDNPRYTICVTMDKEAMPTSGRQICNTVNKLAEYLNKH